MRKLNWGITLIELMIVIVIVGILAAIAYPSYARYVEQARRADAKAALMDTAQRLERCYTQNNTYVGCTLGSATSPDGFYAIAFDGAPTATTYAITATPQNEQAGDTRCGTYRLQSDGTRAASGSLGSDRCW